jgi:hypothetical protein
MAYAFELFVYANGLFACTFKPFAYAFKLFGHANGLFGYTIKPLASPLPHAHATPGRVGSRGWGWGYEMAKRKADLLPPGQGQ